jgi:hypothetical protein
VDRHEWLVGAHADASPQKRRRAMSIPDRAILAVSLSAYAAAACRQHQT